MAKRNIKVPQKHGKINPKATEIKHMSTDDETPVFSFKNTCEKHCQLSDWESKEISLLVPTFKLMEQVQWKNIRKYKGLSYQPIEKSQLAYPLPANIPEDATISEIKVNEKMRVFGYRNGRVFSIIWFDREHNVLPYHKQRA